MAAEKFLLIFESELEVITAEAARWPYLETGGDLFGYWTHSGSPIVHFAIGPGPDSRHHATSFYQDVDFLEREGAALNDAFGLQHIGEWHSHHQLGLDRPSGGDVSTVRGALRRYGFPRFTLAICNLTMGGWFLNTVQQVRVNGFLFEPDLPGDYHVCSWVVLPGASPIRRLRGDTSPLSLRGRAAGGEGAVPPYELRPERLTLADLRRGRPERAPVEEVVGRCWYTTPEGRQRLLAEKEALERSGAVSLSLSPENRIRLRVAAPGGTAAYLLPDGFPDEGPTVAWEPADGEPRDLDLAAVKNPAWSSVSTLGQVHEAVLQALTAPQKDPETQTASAVLELAAVSMTSVAGLLEHKPVGAGPAESAATVADGARTSEPVAVSEGMAAAEPGGGEGAA